MVSAESGQAQVAAAADGPLQPTLERVADHYLWRLEWFLSALRCDIHRSEEGSREAIV